MISLSDFITKYQGDTNIGDTPQNSGQCVGLIEVWTDNLGEPHTWGNACDLLADANRDAFNVIHNSETNFPLPGDVITWQAGWGGSSVGHCAVVVSADVNSFTVFEQNDRIGGGTGSCRTFHFSNYSGVQGWMHPYVLDSPAPQPAVVPVPEPTPVAPGTLVLPTQPEPQPTEPLPVPSPDVPVPVDSVPPVGTPQTADQSALTSSDVLPSAGAQESPLLPPIDSGNVTTSDATTASLEPSTKAKSQKGLFVMLNKLNLHVVVTVLTFVAVIAGALVNYFSATETTSLLGIVAVVAGAVEHAKVTTP